MSPSRPIWPAATSVTFAFAVAGLAQQASAHSLSVTRGSATITGTTLTVRLEQDRHNLAHRGEHDRHLSNRMRAIEEYAGNVLLARLSICDHQGNILTGQRQATKDFTFRYMLPSDSPYVSFNLAAPVTGSVREVANIVLAIRVNGEQRDAIRLGTRGNVEIVRIAPAPRTQLSATTALGTGPCEARRKKWFVSRSGNRTVRSIVSVEEWGVHLEIVVPTPVIETWIPIDHSEGDFIEPSEQQRTIAKLETFVVDRFEVRINGLTPSAPSVKAEFLDFADLQAATDGAPRRLNAWTSGLHVSLQFRSAQRPDRVEVDWKFFNAIVVTASALMVTPNACQEYDFSTYDSRWTWQRR